MTPPQNLVLFHYHLLRGGVRTALLRSLQCLAQEGWFTQRQLVLAVGRLDGARSFAHSLKALVPDVEVIVDPRLDYRDTPWPDEKSFRKDAERLRDALLAWGGESAVFWLHNPTLGKNPAVTAAWKEAAEKAYADGLPHRFLYHIHDFPECGRVENMMRLHRCWEHGGLHDFYPKVPNTAYAVLNSTDRDRLLACGVSPLRVFWLPNVLLPPTFPRPELGPSRRQAVSSALSRYAMENHYVFDPRRPQWLLPVRLIRRKNVLEALFLAAVQPEPPQLLITLDATSAQEKPYAEQVKRFVRENRLPCLIGFGAELVGTAFSFEELMGWSDAVITTSLMEGFGFAFLEGPLLGRPLLGRNLPEVTADFAQAGFPTQPLYERLPVKVPASDRSRLHMKGRRFAEFYQGLVPALSKADVDRFHSRLDTVYGEAEVDFGMLDLSAQKDLLKAAVQGEFKRDLQKIMAPVQLNETVQESFFAQFGPTAHARRLMAAFEGLWREPHGMSASQQDGEPLETSPAHATISQKPSPEATFSRPQQGLGPCLTALFFDPLYQRPLFGGW